jgi:Ni/Co efflux regulator RcnB
MKKLIIGAFSLSLIAGPAMAAPPRHDNHHNNSHMTTTRMAPGHMMRKPVHHGWHKGQKLPNQWRHGHNVDWRAHRLHQPPRGYHWVQTDDDYVLVGIATGVILSTILANQ